jgi:hypothetical protein
MARIILASGVSCQNERPAGLAEPAGEEERMGRYAGKVSLLVVMLGVGMTALAWAGPPAADLSAPTVTVQNGAGEAGQALVGVVGETLTTRVHAMPQVRASGSQPWALEARIASAVVGEKTTKVKVVAQLTPPGGAPRYTGEATGEAASGREAAGAAAGEAMEELGVCLNAKGSAYHYEDDTLEAMVTIGSTNGLRPEARVAFMRKGVMVAEGTVIRVKDADAIVRVDKDVPAGTVLLGDDVRVLRNGPRSAVLAKLAHQRRESGAGAFLALGLLAGLIASAR